MGNQKFTPQISTLPEIGSLLKRSWQIYKERFWVFFGIIILLLVSRFFIFLPLIALKKNLVLGISLFIIFFLCLAVIYLWSQVSLIYVIKDREERIGIRESFKRGWSKIISFFWISILTSLITAGGFLLFIIPGIIFAIWFVLAPFVLVAEDLKGMNVLLRSKQWVSGNWWKVFWRMIGISAILFLISFSLSFPFSIFLGKNLSDIIDSLISVFFLPFFVTYSFLIYENLKRMKGEIPFEMPKKEKIKYILLAIIGLLIPVIGTLSGIALVS
jgi:ABC-type spermidine/putrescine transport system permease subunit I